MKERTRRANAGNRLQSLLANAVPLDEEDAKIFLERDDDEDFDIEAEEERRRMEKYRIHNDEQDEDNETDNESANPESKSSGASEEKGDEQLGAGENIDEEESEENTASSHDDSNFSDTTDDSELENDAEPQDAGEKELQKENKRSVREQRIAERNKLFIIKKRPANDSAQPPKPKKQRPLYTSADLIEKNKRRTERKSAMRNKQHLIEKMKAAEERRAQYVPPKRVHVPKLTQEQRLQEAKLTEIKNLSTLNKFVQLEEERKSQQRLAMISRRPKLTHFVRFQSSKCMEYPKLIEIKSEEDLVQEEEQFNEDKASKIEEQAGPGSTQVEINKDIITNNEKPDSSNSESKNPESTEIKVESGEATSGPQHASHEETKSIDNDEPESKVKALGDENSTEGDGEISIKSEVGVKGENKENIKEEDDTEIGPTVEGPAYLHTYEFLSLHEFHDIHINRFSVRSIILGNVASQHHQPTPKRMCPFSGQPAKYLDPSTGIGYQGLETNELMKLAQENKLGWNNELGGVFTLGKNPQRPARGVPEGF